MTGDLTGVPIRILEPGCVEIRHTPSIPEDAARVYGVTGHPGFGAILSLARKSAIEDYFAREHGRGAAACEAVLDGPGGEDRESVIRRVVLGHAGVVYQIPVPAKPLLSRDSDITHSIFVGGPLGPDCSWRPIAKVLSAPQRGVYGGRHNAPEVYEIQCGWWDPERDGDYPYSVNSHPYAGAMRRVTTPTTGPACEDMAGRWVAEGILE